MSTSLPMHTYVIDDFNLVLTINNQLELVHVYKLCSYGLLLYVDLTSD